VQADVLARKIPPVIGRKSNVDFLTAATFLDKRYHAACRDKWVDGLDPALQRFNVWSDEQRAVLRSERARGYGWAEIAQLIPGKSDHHCMEMVSHTCLHAIVHQSVASFASLLHMLVIEVHCSTVSGASLLPA
jgi:hypothetical protein